MPLVIGDKAPDFKLMDSQGNTLQLDDFKGKWLVLYFYPKDNTQGCTLEALQFTQFHLEFESLNGVIVGISPDSRDSHCKFIEKKELNLILLSDMEKDIIKKYGCWVLKKMYGREYYGVERSTFVISPDSKIHHIFRKVRVKGHVETVLRLLKETIS